MLENSVFSILLKEYVHVVDMRTSKAISHKLAWITTATSQYKVSERHIPEEWPPNSKCLTVPNSDE